MSFTTVRSSWVSGSRLLASEMATIDVNLANALDTNGGGTYVMSAPIVFTSDTWTLPATTFSNTVTVTSTFTANGNAQFLGATTNIGSVGGSDDCTIYSPTTFESDAPVDFQAAVTCATTLGVQGNTTFGTTSVNTMNVYAAATLRTDVTIGTTVADTLTINSAATCANTLGVQGNTTFGTTSVNTMTVYAEATFNDKITAESAQIPKRVYTLATDANVSVSADDYDVIYIPDGVTTTDRRITITTTDVADGTVVEVVCHELVDEIAIAIDSPAGDVDMRYYTAFRRYLKVMVISGDLVAMDDLTVA